MPFLFLPGKFELLTIFLILLPVVLVVFTVFYVVFYVVLNTEDEENPIVEEQLWDQNRWISEMARFAGIVVLCFVVWVVLMR